MENPNLISNLWNKFVYAELLTVLRLYSVHFTYTLSRHPFHAENLWSAILDFRNKFVRTELFQTKITPYWFCTPSICDIDSLPSPPLHFLALPFRIFETKVSSFVWNIREVQLLNHLFSKANPFSKIWMYRFRSFYSNTHSRKGGHQPPIICSWCIHFEFIDNIFVFNYFLVATFTASHTAELLTCLYDVDSPPREHKRNNSSPSLPRKIYELLTYLWKNQKFVN